MEALLLSLGLGLQLIGAYVAFRGFRRGWDEVSGPIRFLDPVFLRVEKAIAATKRLLGIRGRPQTVHVDSIADGAVVAESVTVLKQLAPIDDLEPEEAISRLYEFVNESARDINQSNVRINEHYGELQRALRERTADISTQIAEAAELSQRRSITALRIEASGFILITIGAVVQGIGSFFGLG